MSVEETVLNGIKIKYEDARLYEIYDKELTRSEEEKLKELDIPATFSQNSVAVLQKRYLQKDEKGNPCESPRDLIARVAANIAYPDFHYTSSEESYEKIATEFYRAMMYREFMPNSPTLMNAGRSMQQLSACFVLPVGDSIEDILDSVKATGLVHKTGGGTGFDFSYIRKRGGFVSTTYGKASGPLSFVGVFNEGTEAINQGGFRRGANMGILRVDHPDILNFIRAKENELEFSYKNFNFSVALTDEFMEALKKNRSYPLKNPKRGEFENTYLTLDDLLVDKISIERGLLHEDELTLKLSEDQKNVINPYTKGVIGHIGADGRVYLDATKVFDEIINLAWGNGEPGVVFIDTINKSNPTPHIGEIRSTNPCGEQPLLPYEACNLGSINLGLMVKDGKIDHGKLRKTTELAVHYLDNVVDMSKFPLEEITKMVHSNRKIGLGVMGWADMLYKLRIPYNSDKALKLAEEVMGYIDKVGKEYSRKLSKERGEFPNFEDSVYDDENLEGKIRNATVTTIAPTGTISIISMASSGVEPHFALVYTHTDADGHKKKFVNQELIDILKEHNIDPDPIIEALSNNESLQNMPLPKNIKEIFVTSHDIGTDYHVKMQSAFQKYTDNAVSKTINFPNTATKQDFKEAYLLAYELGCKGITAYRDGSRIFQVLSRGVDRANNKVGGPLEGRTYEVMTGCGKLFVTVNHDDDEIVREVFQNMSPLGGCGNAQTGSVGITTSLYLQKGGDTDKLRQLLGATTCPNSYGLGKNKKLSCTVAMLYAVTWHERYLKNGKSDEGILDSLKADDLEGEIKVVSESEIENKRTSSGKNLVDATCPTCGNYLIPGEGCFKCSDPLCTFTRCE